MGLLWSEIIYAGMGPFFIIHLHGLYNSFLGFLMVLIDFIGRKFIFYGSINPFRQCILIRAAILCHTDSYIFFSKKVNILAATVLDTTIRMVNKNECGKSLPLLYCHFQGF